jgi:hypothetical protein
MTTQTTRNMTPAQARKVFTQATRSMPPDMAKRIVTGAVRAAQRTQAQKVSRQQANARFKEAWNKGSGLER